jgi:hypothetical protein
VAGNQEKAISPEEDPGDPFYVLNLGVTPRSDLFDNNILSLRPATRPRAAPDARPPVASLPKLKMSEPENVQEEESHSARSKMKSLL